MAKVLKISFPDKCKGCELCVMEVQRQLKKIGLDGSPIRIFRNKEERVLLGEIIFSIDMDQNINNLKIKKIAASCPTVVFKIEKVEDGKEPLLK